MPFSSIFSQSTAGFCLLCQKHSAPIFHLVFRHRLVFSPHARSAGLQSHPGQSHFSDVPTGRAFWQRNEAAAVRCEAVCPAAFSTGSCSLSSLYVNVCAYFCGDLFQVYHPVQRRSMRDTAVPLCSFSCDGRWDVGIVVSFGFFIPARFISSFSHGAINGHPSLLPRYRGPAPLTHTLLNGDPKSGVCVIDVSAAAFDVGAVLLKREFDVPPSVLYSEFRASMAEHTAHCIASVLSDLPSHRSSAVPQSSLELLHGMPSSAPKISKAEALIDPAATSVKNLMCKYRAFHGSLGISVLLNEPQRRRVSLDLVDCYSSWGDSSSLQLQAIASAAPGSAVFDKAGKCVWMRCHDGWVALQRFTVEGKKSCDAAAFANGYGISSTQARPSFIANIFSSQIMPADKGISVA